MPTRPDPANEALSELSPDSTAPDGAPGDSASMVGKRVHKYEIVRVIGRGGMGTVYEALNTTIGKRVAMKFVDAETAQNKDSVARFQREAQAASAVESAHIVEIFDAGFSEEGLPFIVMELLRGEDLGHRIKRCGRLEMPEAARITAHILRGLHRAHEAGIVHRDLKPDNIFLVDRDDDPDFAKILDFGISKIQRPGDTPVHTLTRQGTVLGTPFYMSPEQAQAMPDIDGRTDLWSAGAILHECLTGRPPHTGATYEQVIVNICMKDVEDIRTHNPSVPQPVAHVVTKALARERADRFQTAREFLEALSAATGGLVSSRPRGSEEVVAGARATALTPHDGAAQLGLGPTMEAPGTGGPSRVGWSTSRRDAARRERRMFFGVALGALLLGCVGAFLFVRHRREEAAALAYDGAKPIVAPPAPGEGRGVAASDPVMPPAPGQDARVIAPAAASVIAPVVSPAPPAAASADAKPGPSGKHPGAGPHVPPRSSAKPGDLVPPPAVPPPAVPPTPPPKATGTGVASGLQLKTD
jgi:eukaryotic-like serine/threonine-protein kinase